MAICRIHFHAIVLKPVYNDMGTRELRSSLFKKEVLVFILYKRWSVIRKIANVKIQEEK